jgi:DNA-binding GntR family transcriptional regulator
LTKARTSSVEAGRAAVHDQVYAALREALISGRIPPGRGVSLRRLAADLGVSAMPVRDAVRRLAAERALTINPANKRLSVPQLTSARLEQLAQARLWIEPELAARAAPLADPRLIRTLCDADEAVDHALQVGDVDAYLVANHAFHFRLYERAGAEVLLSLAASLWLQTGPFMRVVFDRVGAAGIGVDHHVEAVQALKAGDGEAARRAVAADISVGMNAMAAALAKAAD